MAEPISNLPGEIWKPVVGWEGLYEVSNMGRVASLRPRGMNEKRRPRTPHRSLCKPLARRNGYVHVALCLRNTRKWRSVHHLVLESFVGPRPSGGQCRHLNGITNDNRLSNLLWGTQEENSADKRRHGTALFGERSPTAKLTADDVRYIFSKRGSISVGVLAEQYGVHKDTIWRIWRGAAWSHLGLVPNAALRNLAELKLE